MRKQRAARGKLSQWHVGLAPSKPPYGGQTQSRTLRVRILYSHPQVLSLKREIGAASTACLPDRQPIREENGGRMRRQFHAPPSMSTATARRPWPPGTGRSDELPAQSRCLEEPTSGRLFLSLGTGIAEVLDTAAYHQRKTRVHDTLERLGEPAVQTLPLPGLAVIPNADTHRLTSAAGPDQKPEGFGLLGLFKVGRGGEVGSGGVSAGFSAGAEPSPNDRWTLVWASVPSDSMK